MDDSMAWKLLDNATEPWTMRSVKGLGLNIKIETELDERLSRAQMIRHLRRHLVKSLFCYWRDVPTLIDGFRSTAEPEPGERTKLPTLRPVVTRHRGDQL
jgi:hypothetical protein